MNKGLAAAAAVLCSICMGVSAGAEKSETRFMPALGISGRCYMKESLFSEWKSARRSIIRRLGKEKGVRIPSHYRIKEESAENGADCIILNRSYMFKPTRISAQNAEFYARTVNAIAERLPEVKVYNMLVPDSCEFYAPEEYYCSQTESFEEVYDKLDDSVTPVRIANALYAHADEKIYFRTDHHWTQRGAYYAWQTFMALRNEEVPALEEFERADSDSFVGSFASEGDNAGKVDDIYEVIERFLPIYNVRVCVYEDMEMSGEGIEIELINTEAEDYSGYLAGDNPVTVINGGVRNGRTLMIIKESVGNALASWSVNNYETVYVVDMRKFRDGSFDIGRFYEMTEFDDLLIESYPNTIESADLRAGLKSLTARKR